MKDLIIILATTILIVTIWIGTETHRVAKREVIAEQLLEISTPFNGKIDVEYLKGLKEPAYE